MIVWIAGCFNAKIRAALRGRRNVFDLLASKLSDIPSDAQRIWIHISSLGEYEQGLPLIDELLERFPDKWIIISLFSPSAFDHIKHQKDRTILTYLPFDSYRASVKFLILIRPAIHVIIRHDIWPNYQYILCKHQIPSLLVDASVSDRRLKMIRKPAWIYRQVYDTFTALCVISDKHKERHFSIYSHPERIYVCGDTRYDRVYQRAMDTKKITDLGLAESFDHQYTLVVGSSWPADEERYLEAVTKGIHMFPSFKCIIAPHELDSEHIAELEHHFFDHNITVQRLTQLKPNNPVEARILICDRMGLLANLYALGFLAYVGGGFGVGVHSVLEPAAHGALVCFGPRYLNSPEAAQMVKLNLSRSIQTIEEFESFLYSALSHPEATQVQRKRTEEFVLRNVGAAARTADIIGKYMLT